MCELSNIGRSLRLLHIHARRYRATPVLNEEFAIYSSQHSSVVTRHGSMNQISVATLANFAEIICAGSIVMGLIFGWIQIRHFRTRQRNAVAINLMQTFYAQDLVLDLADGVVTTMNRKLSQWQDDMRESQDQPSWGEWFECLGDQAEKNKTHETPAHVQHRQWKK